MRAHLSELVTKTRLLYIFGQFEYFIVNLFYLHSVYQSTHMFYKW